MDLGRSTGKSVVNPCAVVQEPTLLARTLNHYRTHLEPSVQHLLELSALIRTISTIVARPLSP